MLPFPSVVRLLVSAVSSPLVAGRRNVARLGLHVVLPPLTGPTGEVVALAEAAPLVRSAVCASGVVG